MVKFREAKKTLYTISEESQNQFEFLPWTAASGKNGIREILVQLINSILKHGARSTGEPELRQRHYKNLTELVDFVLNSRKAYLDSVKETENHDVLTQQFESQRSALIYHFGMSKDSRRTSPTTSFKIIFYFPFPVEDEQYELAAKLSEKYLDFNTLVLICDRTKNQARLDEYIQRFQENNFSQYAINWHLQQNKRGDLFERFKHNQSDLSRFLGDHPSLAWIQAIFNGDLIKASSVLFSLAQAETELVQRKKTMLSLAKLTCLAADEDLSDHIMQINNELRLIEYQSQIPIRLLSIFGYDTDNPKVLKEEEIINVSKHLDYFSITFR